MLRAFQLPFKPLPAKVAGMRRRLELSRADGRNDAAPCQRLLTRKASGQCVTIFRSMETEDSSRMEASVEEAEEWKWEKTGASVWEEIDGGRNPLVLAL